MLCSDLEFSQSVQHGGEKKNTGTICLNFCAPKKGICRFTSQVMSKFPMVNETKEMQTILVPYNPDEMIMPCLLLPTFHSNQGIVAES